MNNYELYEIEDFLKDNFFVEWVLVPQQQHEEFWAQWIVAHPHRLDKVERARQILRSLKIVPSRASLSANDLSAIIASINNSITEKKEPGTERTSRKKFVISPKQWFRVAAIFIIIAGAGVLFYMMQQPGIKGNVTADVFSIITESDSVKIYNNSEIKKVAKLDDGSVVILTPHSGLAYTSGFNKQTREITFNGEAFFEIKHNDEKPFVIYSNGIVVKDLGTSFTIRSFAEEDEYKIIVNTGKVQVREVAHPSRPGNNKAIVLFPNQQVTYSRKGSKFKEDNLPKPLPLSEDEAVKNFSYSDAPFNEVIGKLEEAYHIKIQYDKEKFSTYTITASLSRLPLDEKVKMICKVVNAECSFEDGNIQIH